MAKSMDKDLFERLRASGLRKKVAKSFAEVTGRGRRRAPAVVRERLNDLGSMLKELEDRATGGPAKRSAAAKKAAATRKRKAAQRSGAAKKGARTRAGSRSH